MSSAKTKDGHDMFESLSAQQKCIRRGMEEEALYWVSELDTSVPRSTDHQIDPA